MPDGLLFYYMLIDGRKIAERLKERLREEVLQSEKDLELRIIQVGDNAVSNRYVKTKKKFGEALGIHVEHEHYVEPVTEDLLIDHFASLADDNGESFYRGTIVQLPLMQTLDVEQVLNAIPLSMDVDMLSEASREAYESGTSFIVPPVVHAIEHIFDLYDVNPDGKEIAVVGYGRLVGQPVTSWLERSRAHVTVLDKHDPLEDILSQTDIVISGTGVPSLITPDLVREGTVLIDVGTSDAEGELKGDIDPACATKAALFSPVPGGVGPITMAMLFKNLITLSRT